MGRERARRSSAGRRARALLEERCGRNAAASVVEQQLEGVFAAAHRRCGPSAGNDEVTPGVEILGRGVGILGFDAETTAGALTRLNALARRRGLVVVISDFLGPDEWSRPLRVLAARHDVLAIEIVDPRELALPDVGPIVVRDAETGARRHVDTARPDIRARYADAATRRRAAVATRLRLAGAGHIVLRTDGDPVADIGRFLLARRRAAGAPIRRSGAAA